MSTPLQALRAAMADRELDACLIPTADYHNSEYVGDHFACRAWLSGFTGSAGTLLVFRNWAGLWTDGRYFLQAERQLEGTGIKLMKMGEPGVPTISDFLRSSLQPGQTLCFDSRCVTAATARRYYALAKQKGVKIRDREELMDQVWLDRPPRPAAPVWALPAGRTGTTRREKLDRVRAAVAKEGANTLLLTALEDIAWLLDLRGGDVACTPVFLAYLALGPMGGTLFAQPAAFSPELRDALAADGIQLQPYDGVYLWANRLRREQVIHLDPARVNARLLTSIPTGVKVIEKPDPTIAMKAVKDPVEQENFRKAHLDDGVALTRFMYWLKTSAGKVPMTERSAADKLEELRRASPDYRMPSFDPILAFGDHSAVVHYSATEETDRAITDIGFLLADTGGHYTTGTTDCTRTYALGQVSEAQRAHYTAVLRGNLDLAAAVFRAGCTGRNLDILARQPLWELGLDFNHGTGHGVGYLLSVHEGPQSIRWRSAGEDAPLEAGMVTSDEPGVYFAGDYGIRLENLLLCVEGEKTDFGTFLAFETLTLTPFDLDAVDPDAMSPRERALLNAYHARVYEVISPRLPPEEAAWLKEATRPV